MKHTIYEDHIMTWQGNLNHRCGSVQGGETLDPSYMRLIWNTTGIFEKIEHMRTGLGKRMTSLPTENTREIQRLRKWTDQLTTILKGNHQLHTLKRDTVERGLDYRFLNPDLFILAHIRPSMRNVFEELKVFHASSPDRFGLEPEDMDCLTNLPEVARVLGLIGDAAISLALLHIHWDPGMSRVGELTLVKQRYASNHRLALVCDRWGLYGCRIHDDQLVSETVRKVEHAKATIVEALFGIIYVESGLEQVMASMGQLMQGECGPASPGGP